MYMTCEYSIRRTVVIRQWLRGTVFGDIGWPWKPPEPRKKNRNDKKTWIHLDPQEILHTEKKNTANGSRTKQCTNQMPYEYLYGTGDIKNIECHQSVCAQLLSRNNRHMAWQQCIIQKGISPHEKHLTCGIWLNWVPWSTNKQLVPMTTLSGNITDGSNTACAKDCMTRTQMFWEDIPKRKQMKDSNSSLLCIAHTQSSNNSIKNVAWDSAKKEASLHE